MQIAKQFEVARGRDEVVERLCRDETILRLFGPQETEIIARDGDHLTIRTHYVVLGREGDATFIFSFLMDGGLAFEKVCDGRVWRELSGRVSVDEDGDGSLVLLEISGRSKSLIPEFTIKGPLEDQLSQMSSALRELLEMERDAPHP
jgi:hypothetical protein